MDLAGNVIPEFSNISNTLSKYALVPPKEGWFVHDNYLYVVNSTVLEKVLLNALFNNPQDIHDLNCSTTNENCSDFMDVEFPIDSDLIGPMYDEAYKRLVRLLTIPRDNENDSSDGTQISNVRK